MKNILVPTDFSEHANNALDYAVAIANRFGSHITLFYAYKVYSTTGMLVSVERFMKDDAEEDMHKLIEKTRISLMNGATITGVTVKGETIQGIADKADRDGFDIIIMGTQGASGLKEIFMGSVTNGVIRKTRTPVLAIPNECRYKAFKSFVLAMDSREVQTPGLFRTLVFLVKGYDGSLSIYHKIEGEEDDGIDPSLNQWLKGIEHANHFDFSEKGVNESLSEFLADYGGDLLCMVRHKRGFLERIFHQSVTKKEAFTTAIPLLVLQDN